MNTPFKPIISQNFNGGEVFSVEPTLLALNQLQKAINVRFKLGGGFTNRPGFYERALAHLTGAGLSGFQGAFATANEVYLAINGKIYVSLGDLSDAFEIYTGLSTSADVEFLEQSGDIYVMNGVDFPVRIARTTLATALTAGVSVSLDVSSGQGFRFGANGTIKVVSALGEDDITYTARTDDTFTVTAGTVAYSHPASTSTAQVLVLEITSLATAPKIGFGAEFLNTWFAAGNPGQTGQKYSGNTLFYSRGATGVNPEYFYDFAGSGSGFIPVGDKSDIIGLLKTKTYLLILKKRSIHYCSGFDSNLVPIINPLSEVYGTASKRAFAQVGDQVVTFTGRAVKQVGEQSGLNNAIPSVNPQFDDKIIKKLIELDEDQPDAVLHFNPDQKLLKIWGQKGSETVCHVLDTNIAEQPWSRDTGKPAACAFVFKGESFWCSNSEPKIFQDEVGGSDNGIAIRHEILTAEFNASAQKYSKYFKTLYLRGLLGTNTVITVNVYFDGELIQTFTLTDDLIEEFNGLPIGRQLIGGGITVTDTPSTMGFDFEIEKLLKKRRNSGRMSVEFISDGEGQIFEIKTQEINGFFSAKYDRQLRS